MTNKLLSNILKGCAVGDALGWPFEFGTPSPLDYDTLYGGTTPLEITDDTQMTLFTLEGMCYAKVHGMTQPMEIINCIKESYLDWYLTQRGTVPNTEGVAGALLSYPELHHSRAPGTTCMGSMAQWSRTTTIRLNDSKGNGANMRMSPLVFLGSLGIPPQSITAQEIALGMARITHHHEILNSLIPFQQRLMASIVETHSVKEAMIQMKKEGAVPHWLNSLMLKADTLQGWVAEEALAIALVANLRFTHFKDVMEFCIVRDGDSDTIAAIAGAFWGATGKDIPDAVWHRIKEKDVIESFISKVSQELEI